MSRKSEVKNKVISTLVGLAVEWLVKKIFSKRGDRK